MPPPPEDGLLDRDAGPWVEDKLRVLWCYMHGFATACSGKASRWYYVDGLAGPGVNQIGRGVRRLSGSPLLSLEVKPPFARCLFMDAAKTRCRVLRARTERYGNRAVVVEGDCNGDLVPAMREHVDPHFPCLCVLDPEGSEVHWSTVRDIASFRRGRYKVEQLILLPTDTGFVRELPIDERPSEDAVERINGMYGNDRWLQIYRRRQRGELTPDQARTEYVKLYARGLREHLGYKHALDRQILRRGRRGHPLYFLIFATDHPAGHKIMNHCMDTGYPDEPQMELFKLPRRTRLER